MSGVRTPGKVVRRLKILPLAARVLKNWPSFVYHYALGLTPASPYSFRSGATLSIGRAIDHVPIIEIFMRQDYGRVPDNAVVLDLGANIGAFAIYAASGADNVRLFAYEPAPEFYRLMVDNIRGNGLQNQITCFNLAVAGSTGDRTLRLAAPGLYFPTLAAAPEPGPSTTVRCTTLPAILDTIDRQTIDLLKMDIEGAEYEVLYGTTGSCFDRIRRIRLEYHDLDTAARNLRSLRTFLIERNYRVTHERRMSPTNGTLWVEQHD